MEIMATCLFCVTDWPVDRMLSREERERRATVVTVREVRSRKVGERRRQYQKSRLPYCATLKKWKTCVPASTVVKLIT